MFERLALANDQLLAHSPMRTILLAFTWCFELTALLIDLIGMT